MPLPSSAPQECTGSEALPEGAWQHILTQLQLLYQQDGRITTAQISLCVHMQQLVQDIASLSCASKALRSVAMAVLWPQLGAAAAMSDWSRHTNLPPPPAGATWDKVISCGEALLKANLQEGCRALHLCASGEQLRPGWDQVPRSRP